MGDNEQTGVEEVSSPGTEEQETGQVDESGEGVAEDTAAHEEEGFKQAMLAERRKSQSMAVELEAARRSAAFYRDMAMQGGREQAPSQDKDEYPTTGRVDEIVNQRLSAVMQDQRRRDVERMDQAARERYADYDEVFMKTLAMTEKNPGLARAILETDNPAETAYLLGKATPEFEQGVKQRAAQGTAKKIQQNLQRPKTLSDAGGSAQPPAKKDWSKATDAEYDKRYKEIMGLD